MNIAEFSIKRSVITWTMTFVLLFVGILAFQSMSRLEDPEFTIKNVIVLTPYPGASAAEVEEEVTNVIEMAIQELGQVDWIESKSSRGLSYIKVHIQDKYDKTKLPQVFDELRRKVNDRQRNLPPGAGPSLVNDDFGDVYGVFLALTGEDYSYKELYDFAKLLRKEILLVTDVKKVILYGDQAEVVWVEMSRSKMAALGVSQEDIYRALAAKNLPADAGRLRLGADFIPINPTGEFKSEQEFGDLLITARGGSNLVYLRDVAEVRRGYVDPPKTLLRFDGKKAVGIAISTALGGNVVTMGEGIKAKLKELEDQTPVGMELNVIAMQSEAVTTAIDEFMINLIEAVIIVIVVLLFAMGLRSGLIIGGILLLTICGTFVFMQMQGVILERVSLGALIIALGMLVDNAIVVVDGMKVRMEQGMDAVKAASEVVGQTAVPLLGATFVAILAFASIGTSQDNTGEYCRSLFTVIFISLTMSWVAAVTTTPLVAKLFLKGKPASGDGEEARDPYAGKLFQVYKGLLTAAIRNRWVTVGVIVGVFVASVIGFGFIKQMFFPNSTRSQFFIECYLPEGTHIRQTEARLSEVEQYVLGLEGVTHVGTVIGGGEPRFLLTYSVGSPSTSYGVIFVDVDDYRLIQKLQPEIQNRLFELIPEGVFNVTRFVLGPGEGGKIQLRISGSDQTTLRQMARTVKDIMYESGNAKALRDEWKEKVKVVRPQLAEAQARRLGITRPQVADALRAAFEGKTAGVYREGEELLPIIARAPESERLTVDNIQDLQIWSPAAQRMIPMRQVISGFTTETEDANIQRRNRKTMIKIHCDPLTGLPSELFAAIKAKIEKALNADVRAATGTDVKPEDWDATTITVVNKGKIPLKDMPGYSIAWGGEAEDSASAQDGLKTTLPIFFAMMVLIVIFLFNAFKQALVIWLTAPLAIIGVTMGLLLFGQPFGFMALLGLLSLVGMVVKNSVVLVDQIDAEIASGKERFQAVIDSGVSRLNPVMMAALTTILGMIPLLQDAFWVSMAVTIMFGLLVATVLTLIVAPVFYSIFFKIPNPNNE